MVWYCNERAAVRAKQAATLIAKNKTKIGQPSSPNGTLGHVTLPR